MLIVMDAGYGVMRLSWLLRDLPVELVGRLRPDPDLRLPAPPRVYQPKGGQPSNLMALTGNTLDPDIITTSCFIPSVSAVAAWDINIVANGCPPGVGGPYRRQPAHTVRRRGPSLRLRIHATSPSDISALEVRGGAHLPVGAVSRAEDPARREGGPHPARAGDALGGAGPRGQLAGDSLGDAENPATASSAADHTEVLATRLARFIKGTEDLHRRGTPTYPLIDRPCLGRFFRIIEPALGMDDGQCSDGSRPLAWFHRHRPSGLGRCPALAVWPSRSACSFLRCVNPLRVYSLNSRPGKGMPDRCSS